MEPEPSYAYLLENEKERKCVLDLEYCTRDKDRQPIPYCNMYPNDKKCYGQHIPPGTSLMGCYDDKTCGGRYIGTPKTPGEAPYAYTTDGRCERSQELCQWSGSIPISSCKSSDDVGACRDSQEKVLHGCFSEKTCNGNVDPTKPRPYGSLAPLLLKQLAPVAVAAKKRATVDISSTTLIAMVIFVILIIAATVFFLLHRSPHWPASNKK